MTGPLLLLGSLGFLAWFMSGDKAGNGYVGPTPGQELPALALGAYRQPWPGNGQPSVLSAAVEAYQARGIVPTGLLRFTAEWNAAGDLPRSQYAMAAGSVNAQTAIDVATTLSGHGFNELAAGLLLLARFFNEGPTPNLSATADWMARGADPATVP
jgi:hypothetical protein